MTIKVKTIHLTHQKNGYWLYDDTRAMNLSMRAETAEAAYIEALEYYQKRLLKVEKEHEELCQTVNAFVTQFSEQRKDW